jgi:hypothetical protein
MSGKGSHVYNSLCNAVPQSLIDRYRNEVLFRKQVQRAVSTVLQLVQEAESAADQQSGAQHEP